MDSTRASKRRRLDSPSHETRDRSPSSTIHVTATTNLNNEPQSSAPSPAPAKSTQELWKEAKARKRPASQRSKSTAPAKASKDVYDDFDGANGETRSPVKKTTTAAAAAAGSGAKGARKGLDPLRNQTDVTPKKAAGGGSLGFFKQFVDKTASPVKVGNGAKGVAIDGESGLGGLRTQRALDSQLGVGAATPRAGGEGQGALTDSGTRKARTFEDEIREVERQARREAAEDGGEGDRNGVGHSGRSSGRKVMGNGARYSSQRNGAVPEESPFYRSARKRQQEAFPAKEVHVNDATAGDQMEIDESDHEIRVQQRELPTSKAKKAAQQDHTLVEAKPRASTALLQNGEPGSDIHPDAIALFQRVLLDKLTHRRPIPLTNLEDEYAKVMTVINQTITAGESNSMLLIGARGSGKTTLVNQIIRKHSVEHPDDFLVVKLDGFVHTDDKIALREIWRQLGKGMELDEEEMATKSYADTLATLLALLSHPAEQGREERPGQVTKSVIFVMDEFDLFATHPRQTLLYNLFDIAQSRKAPIAVLGLTTRVDVAESLEKRVKSRFSHRYVHLSLPRSFAMFHGICRAAINIEQDDLTQDEQSSLVDCTQALADWSNITDNLLNTEATATALRRIYYTTKSIPDFLSSLHLPLSTLSPLTTTTSASIIAHLSSPALTRAPDSKLSLLSSLSTLHLALLVSAARLTTLYDTASVSFALAYEEYKVLASKMKVAASASGALAQGAGGRVWGKAVARGAWEGLGEMGLVVMPGDRVDVGLEEIGACPGLELGSWGRWCREI
ncbi:hypothetical protein MBLNU230_g4261t1 [Neophaeotheca triangularis]